MNTQLVNEINELVVSYIIDKNDATLAELHYKLQIHELQIQLLKSKVQLVENPEAKFTTAEYNQLKNTLSHRNAFRQHELLIPMLMYLFKHHHEVKPALETALRFMRDCAGFLHPGDYAKTKTGVQRFLTNTRFAVMTLRNLGLIRSGSHTYNKNWELTLFGILLAGIMFIDGYGAFKNEIRNEENIFTEGSIFTIIGTYMRQLSDPGTITRLTNTIYSDPIVMEQIPLYADCFREFVDRLNVLLTRIHNQQKNADIAFSAYINEKNHDPNITMLTDSIILKKELDIQMDQILKILKGK